MQVVAEWVLEEASQKELDCTKSPVPNIEGRRAP